VIYEFSYQARVCVRLGLKSMPGTNTLAYYVNLLITDKKSFMTLGPGPNVIKNYGCSLRMFVIRF
jgi:hypothetical protein